ncbi:MAG: sporulation histidine kinase inhibitor Sda [Heyndrickxia sp.]
MRNLESLIKLSDEELMNAFKNACKLKLSLEFINLLKEELIKRRVPF